MNVLEILAECEPDSWTAADQIMMQANQPELVPILLETLVDRKLADSIPNDKKGRLYRISPAGFHQLHVTNMQNRISSFPPPRL